MQGVLFVCMVADELERRGLDDWYDREHLPGRMTVPGFLRATRYRELGDAPLRATACLYELESPSTLETDAYLALQGRTAADTEAHLARVQRMWRLVGRGSSAHDEREPAPALLAALGVPGAGELAEAPPGASTRRFATDWEGAPADLVLHELPRADAPAPTLDGPVVASWLLERTGTTGPSSSVD